MGRRGFSLAEVCVGLLFLALTGLGLVGAQLYSLRSAPKRERLYQASLLASAQLAEAEQLLNTDFDNQVGVNAARHSVQPGFEVARAVSNPPAPDNGFPGQLLRVNVSVYYGDAQGPHEFQLSTYVARPTS